MSKKPTVLMILDGYGLNDNPEGNAIKTAKTPVMYLLYELTRITKAIDDGDFFENPELSAAMDNCKKNNSALHIMGLLSDGGVHSHNSHLYAIVKMAKKYGLKKVFIHAFMDGRDTPPTSGKEYLSELEEELRNIGLGKIATVSGRYYAMDRDKRWDRIQKA